eukprot:TRINITY_DN7803_c0_g1_i1.p1 TRINITY_DN7803_c0_g1~~TRINITY_DN7803_c0_g1_i1.p1  ORF type:complete len:124 (+),score=3.28 TRINITY_DN7803_c0_g1_i1:1-372(+)
MRGRMQALRVAAGRPAKGSIKAPSAILAAEASCAPQMEALLNCWKQNAFEDKVCSSDHVRFLHDLTHAVELRQIYRIIYNLSQDTGACKPQRNFSPVRSLFSRCFSGRKLSLHRRLRWDATRE